MIACRQSGLNRGVKYTHESACTAALRIQEQCPLCEFQTSSGNDSSDEGVPSPRPSGDGGTSMDVDTSDAYDRSVDEISQHGDSLVQAA